MSSVDAIAALAAQAAAMQDTAGAEASLDLGAAAQVLQAQLATGDVLEATVLAPKGGQDLISILGQTVVAQLPPDVHPGEQLLLQVTGFTGNQILVRNLGVQDPMNPVPVFVPELPLEAQSATANAATLTTIVQQERSAGAPAIGQPQAQPAGPPVAPPASVFVAASVVRPADEAAAAPQSPQTQTLPAQQTQPQAIGQTPPQQLPAQPAPAHAAAAAPDDIEARLAAARAATAERTVPKPAAARATDVRQAKLPPAAPAAAPRTQAFSQTVFAKPPLTITQRPPQAPAPTQPAVEAQPSTGPAPQAAAAAVTVPQRSQLAAAAAAKDPVRLLAALRIPATPVTLAAARAAGTAAQQVTSALQNLERVLAQGAPPDARISTLQTVTSFIAHLDPRAGQTFAAQLSAFASNVLDGAEGKLSQLLAALSARLPRAAHAPAAAPPAAAPEQPAATAAAPASPAPPAHVPILAQARAVERELALTQDLKSTVLSLLANPPAGTPAQLTQALGDTLTALTAMQMNALVSNQTDPNSVILNIPVMFYDGGQAAQIRVQRDAPKKRERLDADNFHIAFVLDTASLGTVAIDLETVGRTVKVGVKTDRASAVPRLQTSLPDLAARLEQLRYRVASAGAEMALSPKDAQLAAAADAPAHASDANLDLQA